MVQNDAINKGKQKSNFDTHHGAIDHTPLSPGDRVWVTDRGSDATVVTEAAPRSYEVQTPDGTYRRNRRHLVVLPHTSSTTPSSDEGSAESKSMPRLTEGSDTCESNDEQPVLRRSGRASKPPDRCDPSESSSSFDFDRALAYALSCMKQEVLSLKDQQVEAVKLLSEGDVFVVSFILNCYCACMLTVYCVHLLTVVFVECHVLKWS